MIQVSAAVITRGKEVLACQRRAGVHHPLQWEFPGGKLELGETAEQCLRRELQEELGIEAEVDRELWRTCHQYPGQEPVELRFFLVQAYRGLLTNHAFAQVRWLPVAALSTLDFLHGDRGLIAALHTGEVALG